MAEQNEKKDPEKAQKAKPAKKKEEAPSPAPAPEPPEPESKVPKAVVELIADAVETMADEDGYAFMGDLGNLLVKKQPDFDPRNFGFSKLTQLVRYLPRFEVDVRQTSLPHVKHIYVRDKARK